MGNYNQNLYETIIRSGSFYIIPKNDYYKTPQIKIENIDTFPDAISRENFLKEFVKPIQGMPENSGLR